MITKYFVNKMNESSIRKIEDDREFSINEAKEKADMDAIIEIANIQYINALKDENELDHYEILFKNLLQCVTKQYTSDDYDYINQGTIEFDDYKKAADFLTCCKLFIKFSSDYDLTVNKGGYTFHFNTDRISDEVLL